MLEYIIKMLAGDVLKIGDEVSNQNVSKKNKFELNL